MPARTDSAPPQPPLDEETAAALTLYNTYLVADREQQAHERALKKAERAKDEAAKAVRKLNERKAPASEAAAAEAAYRETVEALRRLRNGEAAAPPDEDQTSDPDDAPATVEDPAAGGDESTDMADAAPTADDEDPNAGGDESTDAADAAPTADDEDPNAGGAKNTDAADAASVGVEASVGDDDLAGDEPARVAG